jgi:outer membrane protein TolC
VAKETFNYEQKFAIDSLNLQLQQQVFNLKYKPQLFAYGTTGLNATDASNLPHSVGLTAALHLNIPIYDGGQKKIVAAQNKLGLDNLQQYKNQTTVQVHNNLLNLEQQISITEKSISLLNSQLADQETVLQLLKEKVVSGQVSVTDFLNAVENYTATNQQKIQTATNLSLLINQYNYVNW